MFSRLSKTLLVISLLVLSGFLLAKIKVPNGNNSKQLTVLLPLEENIADSVGVYFWGGSVSNPSGDMIKTGAQLSEKIGTSSVRITMSPKSDMDYKNGGCITGFSLKSLAARADFNTILSDPNFKTIMITAYDGVSFPDCSTKNYLVPGFFTAANTARIQNEYSEFASYLASNFSGKTFIISNWEGDNDIYCGAAYGATSASCSNYSQSLAGFTKWINTRTAGIKASSGASNVFSAVEFNIVRNLKDRNLPSVLYDVIPNIDADYFSYSSYESINALYNGDNGAQLKTDVDTIRNVLSSAGESPDNLIIGEYGFDQGSRDEIKNKLAIVTNTINELGIDHAFVWNLLDSGGSFGLYDSGAKLTVAGSYFCNSWGGSACAAETPTPTPTPTRTPTPALTPTPTVTTPTSTSGAKGGLVPCGRSQDDPSTPENETRMCTICDIFALASRVINFVLFTVVPAIAVLFYLIGGLMILLSRGDPGLVATGKNFFWNTTWGLVIIFGAWMITNTVLKSLVGDKDISNNWYKIECTNPAQAKPPSSSNTPGGTIYYICDEDTNQCRVDPEGNAAESYTTSDCSGHCTPAQVFYICDEDTNQCRVDPEGNVTESYTDPNCKGHCAPAQTFYVCDADTNQCRVDPEGNVTESYTDSNCKGHCVSPITINTTSLSDASVGQSYSQNMQATGGKTPYNWSLDDGNLPDGLNISKDGKITGTPAKEGIFTFTIGVEDSTATTPQDDSKDLTIKVVSGAANVTISEVAVEDITSSGATITWTTDKPSTSQVEYGTGGLFNSSTAIDNTKDTDHSVDLTSLTPNTTYNFRAKSSITGFTAVSSTNTFKTLASGTSTGATCMFSNLNLCQGNSSGGCSNSSCSQYAAAINNVATKMSISANILKAFMEIESSCNINAVSGTSYGLMQLSPDTASSYRNVCGVSETINGTWLVNPANAEKSICIAAAYINAIAQSQCGSSVRNLYAGYNGGAAGASSGCANSNSCYGETGCDGGPVKKWECLYDDGPLTPAHPQHTTCNGGNDIMSGFNQTKQGATKIIYCADNPGF